MKGFYIFLSIAWLALGTWLTKSNLCSPKEKASAAVVANSSTCDYSLVFKDGDFIADSDNNFEFKFNSDVLVNQENITTAVLQEVSKFLADNPDKTIAIEGVYSEKETNNTGQNNLGIARAAAIKDYLVGNFEFNDNQIRLNSHALSSTSCFNKSSKTLKKGAIMTFGVME